MFLESLIHLIFLDFSSMQPLCNSTVLALLSQPSLLSVACCPERPVRTLPQSPSYALLTAASFLAATYVLLSHLNLNHSLPLIIADYCMYSILFPYRFTTVKQHYHQLFYGPVPFCVVVQFIDPTFPHTA